MKPQWTFMIVVGAHPIVSQNLEKAEHLALKLKNN